MATLNRLPMEILDGDERLRAAAHGCTDITGFGLVGHLHEMAAASGVSIHLDPTSLPVLAGAREFADMGIIPEGAYRNRTFYRPWVRSALPEHDSLEMIVHDPQTSGGLLLAMEPASAGAPRANGCAAPAARPPAPLIGTVRAGGRRPGGHRLSPVPVQPDRTGQDAPGVDQQEDSVSRATSRRGEVDHVLQGDLLAGRVDIGHARGDDGRGQAVAVEDVGVAAAGLLKGQFHADGPPPRPPSDDPVVHAQLHHREIEPHRHLHRGPTLGLAGGSSQAATFQ